MTMSSFTTYHLFFSDREASDIISFWLLWSHSRNGNGANSTGTDSWIRRCQSWGLFFVLEIWDRTSLGLLHGEEHSFEGACLASGAWVAFHIHRKGQGQGMPGLEEGLRLPNCPVLELLDPNDLVVQSPPFLHRKQSSQPAGKVSCSCMNFFCSFNSASLASAVLEPFARRTMETAWMIMKKYNKT